MENTFNNFHQQYVEFLEDDNLIDNYPVLYPLINNLFQVARRQKTHERYLMRQNNLGNTYNNDLSGKHFSEHNKSIEDNISLHPEGQIANNFKKPISDQNYILIKEHLFQPSDNFNENLTESKADDNILSKM